MTNAKTLKRTLFSSVISLLLCFTMLLGTTFAWFTDSVTSSGNIIKSGTLDVEMYWADGKADPAADTTVWTDASSGAIFNNDKWEPGYTEVRHIKIANEGTLALKYMVEIVPEGTVSELADVIDVYYADPALQVADGDALTDAMKLGTLKDALANLATTGSGTLAAQTADTITIAFKMQESAGNLYQDKSIGTSFAIQLVATQVEAEEDSFGPDYDAEATYPELSGAVKVPDVATETETVATENLKVELPAEFLNNLPNAVTSVQLAHSEPTIDSLNKTIVFDSVEILDQNGQIVDLEALGNDKKVTVTLPVGNTFAAGAIVQIFHNGVQIAEAVVDANKNITYEVEHFCEITVAEKANVTVVFSDGFTVNFSSLARAMRFGYSGGTQEKIIVNNDIEEEMDSLEGNIVSGKEGGVTIKNTIYNSWIYCDSTNFTIGEGVTYDASGYSSGLFVYGDNCVINGTVLTDCYYQRYADTKLTINAPGSMKVLTETFILRYTDGDPNAGIYINGDGNDETVEFQLAVAYFYQGMICAKDATLKVGTYWQTNSTDGAGSANLVLDNSKLTVTVNEHNFRAIGNATVTLKNGSVLDVAGGIETTNEIVCDETSVVKSR